MGETRPNPDLNALISGGKRSEILTFCEDSHPALVAELLGDLSYSKSWNALNSLPPLLRADIFTNLSEDYQTELLLSLGRQEAAQILTDMPPDDRTDLFKRMPEDRREAILPAMAHAEREDIRRLASYKEGTVGSMMTSDYATLDTRLTAAEAINRLRIEAPNKETIYYAYVLDPSRKLLGFVSLRDLILAKPDDKITDIMHYDTIYATVGEDQEIAARRLQKYDLIVMPVIDAQGVLVGIITHDDAFDIIVQEQTEDMEKLVAITGLHEAGVYLKTSPWGHFKNRVLWVMGLAVIGLISGMIVQRFEDMLALFPILAVFMPMLADTGGNTGSQSATLVVRGIALQEIRPRDMFHVLFKEFQVAVMLAFILAGVAFGRVLFFGSGQTFPGGMSLLRVGSAVALALGMQVISATLIGALLPMIAARFKLDPAVVASPALTTIVDITGLLLYFSIARMIIGI